MVIYLLIVKIWQINLGKPRTEWNRRQHTWLSGILRDSVGSDLSDKYWICVFYITKCGHRFEFSLKSPIRFVRPVRIVGWVTLRKMSTICQSIQISVFLDKMKVRINNKFLMCHKKSFVLLYWLKILWLIQQICQIWQIWEENLGKPWLSGWRLYFSIHFWNSKLVICQIWQIEFTKTLIRRYRC